MSRGSVNRVSINKDFADADINSEQQRAMNHTAHDINFKSISK